MVATKTGFGARLFSCKIPILLLTSHMTEGKLTSMPLILPLSNVSNNNNDTVKNAAWHRISFMSIYYYCYY